MSHSHKQRHSCEFDILIVKCLYSKAVLVQESCILLMAAMPTGLVLEAAKSMGYVLENHMPTSHVLETSKRWHLAGILLASC